MTKANERFFSRTILGSILLVLIIIVGVLGQLNGGDMDMYLKAQRINNG